MRRIWPYLLLFLLIGAGGFYFFANWPLTVAMITPQRDVPLRLYRLGSAEARSLSRSGFVLSGTVTHDEKILDRFDRLIHLRDGRLADA